MLLSVDFLISMYGYAMDSLTRAVNIVWNAGTQTAEGEKNSNFGISGAVHSCLPYSCELFLGLSLAWAPPRPPCFRRRSTAGGVLAPAEGTQPDVEEPQDVAHALRRPTARLHLVVWKIEDGHLLATYLLKNNYPNGISPRSINRPSFISDGNVGMSSKMR